MKLTVVKQISAEKKKTYYALVLDLEYARKYISFDKYLCMELLEKSPRELEELPLGEYIIIEKGENV